MLFTGCDIERNSRTLHDWYKGKVVGSLFFRNLLNGQNEVDDVFIDHLEDIVLCLELSGESPHLVTSTTIYNNKNPTDG